MRSVRLGVLIFLSLLGAIATQAQWPYVPVVQSESNSANSASITCTFNGNVTIGDYGIMLMSWFNTNNAPVMSDTRSSTYTQKLIDTSHTERVAVYTTTFGSSGANTVTMAVTSGQFMNIQCIEAPPLWSLTVDVSAVSSFSGTPATVTTPSVTTTKNNDLVLAFIGNDNTNVGQTLQAADVGTWSQIGWVQIADSQMAFMRVGGAAGAGNNVTLTNKALIGTTVTIAFASNSLAVTSDTAAPDGATSNTYNWCALAAGGSGSYTWSVSSGALPTSLSINSSTGCITGTPTVSNNYTATIQVTDGTNTATKSITFKIATALNTIAFVQGKTAATSIGSGTLAFTSNVGSGNLLLVAQGYSAGRDQAAYCTDTVGTVFKTLSISMFGYSGSIPNSGNMGGIAIMAGFAAASGADTVTCNGTAFVNSIAEFSNVQFFANDNTLYTRGANASPATITSSNLTTLVPNELIFGVCQAFPSGASSAVNAPFSQVGTTFASTAGYQVVTTVTTYTMSCAQTLNTLQAWQIALAGFRPSSGSVVPPASARRRSHMIL